MHLVVDQKHVLRSVICRDPVRGPQGLLHGPKIAPNGSLKWTTVHNALFIGIYLPGMRFFYGIFAYDDKPKTGTWGKKHDNIVL